MRIIVTLSSALAIAALSASTAHRFAHVAAVEHWAVFAFESSLDSGPAAPPVAADYALLASRCDARRWWQTDRAAAATCLELMGADPQRTADSIESAQRAVEQLENRIARSASADDVQAAGNELLRALRQRARDNPLCTAWTCPDLAAPEITPAQAGWARRRVLDPVERQIRWQRDAAAALQARLSSDGSSAMLARDATLLALGLRIDRATEGAGLVPDPRSANGVIRRMNSRAASARSAGEVLSLAMWVPMALGMLGLVLAMRLRQPVWPLAVLVLAGQGAAWVHATMALGSFDLRHVELGHLAFGAWAMPAALAVTLIVLPPVCRSHWANRLAGRWLAIVDQAGAARRGALCALATVPVFALPAFGVQLLPAVLAEVALAGCVAAAATFTARNLDWTEVEGTPSALGWPVVVLALVAALALTALRGDGGAMLLALLFAIVWLALTVGRASALALAACIVLIVGVWWQWLPRLDEGPQSMPALLDGLARWLPQRIEERVRTAWAPFDTGPSDVARSIWQARSGGAWGWGFAFPAEGLGAGRVADRTLLQGPADYLPSLAAAVFGRAGLFMLAAYAAAGAALAAIGLRNAARPGTTPAARWLGCAGAFGMTTVVLRVVITTAGSLGLGPLTGIPAPGLALGKAAALMAGVYAGCCLVGALRAGRNEPRSGS